MKHVALTLRSKRGSAMIAVFVIATAIAAVLAAILSHSLTERRVNSRHELRLIAKNASEAVVEYGFAQLRHKFDNRTNFDTSALSPNSDDALAMPDSEMFGPSLDYVQSEIVGGLIDEYPSTLTYLDPANPANEFDPLRGQKVYARQIALYAKATVNDPRGGPDITNYVTQKMQVRDAPLFAHAIFYNLDLEVSPGPKMEIHGPVHTNGNLYLQAISGVDFHYPVSTAKDMYYGWATNVRSAQGAGNESLQTGDVKFKNRAENLVSMKDNGVYMDSRRSDWRVYSANRWNGYLLTQDHGVENYQPVAFPDYQPDNPATSKYDPVNSGHALIERPLSAGEPGYNEEIEKQKLSNKAGLYFKWYVDEKTPYEEQVRVFDKNGREYDITKLIRPAKNPHWDRNDYDYYYNPKDYLIQFLPRSDDDSMYDHRRYYDIDLVEINMGKLKQLIENPDYTNESKHFAPQKDSPGAAAAKGSPEYLAACYTPSSKWNGIVYFETISGIDPEHLQHSGVRLWGGETDVNGQGIPSLGPPSHPDKDPGLTFATNNALYVKGHFNADGHIDDTWSSQNSAIVPELGEVPVALYGDSVTILSGDWDDSRTYKKPQAKTTEVAAAIVSGLIPTNANNNGRSSGGVHNFPRFLESWDGRALYIRGSLVCLYESEVDNSAWRIDYYAPPARNWGFSELFLNGTYPPGTPLLRTYRRINYTNLTESEYNSALASMPWSNGPTLFEDEPEEDTNPDPFIDPDTDSDDDGSGNEPPPADDSSNDDDDSGNDNSGGNDSGNDDSGNDNNNNNNNNGNNRWWWWSFWG